MKNRSRPTFKGGSPAMFTMRDSPTSRRLRDSKGLFHTGIFLRPRIATSLQGLIRNKTIQDRAKFTVAKSQIHPNGLCEIVVKRQDPNVSTNAIMELLERCRMLVEEHILPEAGGMNNDLNSTIDVSDTDDSICIVSPSPIGGRKISFKRTLSVSSPISSRNVPVINQPGIEPLVKRSNLIINVNSQPSSSIQDRRVLLQSKDCASAQHSPNRNVAESSKASIGGENIVVKVLNDMPSTSSQCDDANSSVMILDVCEDAAPSAPTWTTSPGSSFPLSKISQNLGKNLAMDVQATTSQGSSFPLASISQNLGKNLAMDVQVNSSKTPSSVKSDQEKMTQRSDICSPGDDLIRRFSEVVKENCKPKVLTSVEPVQDFGNSTDQSHSSPIGGFTNLLLKEKERESVTHTKIPNVSEQNIEAKEKGGELVQVNRVAQVTEKSAPNDVQTTVSNQLGTEIANCQVGERGADRASSSASGELSSDDDIIIEKEMKSNKPPSLLIEDSDDDDDIAVCKVVTAAKVVNEPMLSKKQKKKLKKRQNMEKLGTSIASTSSGPAPEYTPLFPQRTKPKTSNQPPNWNKGPAASTSSGPAPDYIPLFSSSHSSMRPSSHSNRHQNLSKTSKFQKIHDKKEKKAKALRSNAVQSGKVDSSSEQKQSSPTDSKEKKEFGGNIFNPNPEIPKTGLRPVVIDASNVAIAHGRGPFSVRGLQICIKYFTDRGHKVFAFAPKYRRFHVPPEERKAMDDLENQGILSFTPSRTMEDGRKVASYDDRYIVQLAAELGGVIISTDNYRDLLSENEAWRETIEQRLLMFTWVGDIILFPNDPLGRNGPHLQDFLRFPDPTPKK
ncbi:uncharacterized protein LOC117651394 isoform X2 [Thrips palmi]|uniref:Uncharacterized protein LOC117651394 isoform X2 n=1 Tax=Thrips palmi TaxID=161013 RepID=A0A6P9A3L9_THRPL|nr:uncharacterized protein LOC117651394 isoform X2 [Thrips palmi]